MIDYSGDNTNDGEIAVLDDQTTKKCNVRDYYCYVENLVKLKYVVKATMFYVVRTSRFYMRKSWMFYHTRLYLCMAGCLPNYFVFYLNQDRNKKHKKKIVHIF